MPLPTATATEDDVRGVLEAGHVPEDVSLVPFITAAVMAMDGRGAYQRYTDADQKRVLETWLGAHFTCIAYPLLSQEEIGRSEERVERKIDMGLDQTPYGQMFRVFDVYGLFRRRGLRVSWLGTVPAGVGQG